MRYPVRTLAATRPVLTEVLCGCPHFLQSYVYMLAQSDQDRFLPNRYPFLQCPSCLMCILRYRVSADMSHECLRGYELGLSNKCIFHCLCKKLCDVYRVHKVTRLYKLQLNTVQTAHLQTHIFLQQKGSPLHWGLALLGYLDEKIPGRWIGREDPVPWPRRSPDITSLDFFRDFM